MEEIEVVLVDRAVAVAIHVCALDWLAVGIVNLLEHIEHTRVLIDSVSLDGRCAVAVRCALKTPYVGILCA